MIQVLTINWTNAEGGTVGIINSIEEGLSDRCCFTNCFQVGDKHKDSDMIVTPWNVTRAYYLLSRITGIKYGLGTIPTRRLLKKIEELKPDIVHIHCPNFYNINLYLLFDFLKKCRIPTIITNHAEFFYTGNCAHAFECTKYTEGCKKCDRQFDRVHPYIINRTAHEWKKMKKAFEGADSFVMTVVSGWQKKRIETSPLTKGLPVVLIENGVDTEVFRRKDHPFDRGEYKHVALHVTSQFCLDRDNLKGGYYLVKLAEQMPETLFLVLGTYVKGKEDNLPGNLQIIGRVSKEKLAEYYNVSDVTVLTSKRETFGMACAESLCCGTPVAAFEAGGTESIAIPEWSRFAPFGDTEELKSIVEEIIDLKGSQADRISEEATEKYSEKAMVEKYYGLYEQYSNK